MEDKKYEVLRTIDGEYKTVLTQKYKQRKVWVRPDIRQMYSFIPGTITQIAVRVGQEVKKGDTLMMFNAMKMSNTLKAPFDGRIATIAVREAEVVPKGVLLLEFE